MKTMTENFGGNEYPPMKLPKQENATSSFEEKCNGLVEIISRSFDFFMWYAQQKTIEDAYGFTGIPHTILFAPDGTILARGLRGVNIDKKLEELFNDNNKTKQI